MCDVCVLFVNEGLRAICACLCAIHMHSLKHYENLGKETSGESHIIMPENHFHPFLLSRKGIIYFVPLAQGYTCMYAYIYA